MTCRRSCVVLVSLTLVLGTLACSRAIRSTQTQPPNPLQMAEFWVDTPVESRDVIYGPGRPGDAPAPNSTLLFVRDDTTGFSRKVDVKDEKGTAWNAKLGPEAQPEVVSSRLVWALGYHQVPQYVVGRWIMKGGELGGTMPAARFRRDDEPGYKTVADEWSWHENPFVGTQAYKGLLVLMIMLNNSDLKPAQNRIYEVTGQGERSQRVYVVRDLGLSWGESGISNPKRGDVEAFERQGFIKRVNGNRIEFDQKNLRAELFTQITPDDLRWIGTRMARITDKQWHDMFRAAAYEDDALINRFIARMKQKIQQAIRVQADAEN
jgi:hypothetical protein